MSACRAPLATPILASAGLSQPSIPSLCRYQEPKLRPDGYFVAGKRLITVTFNLWRVLGHTGEVRGEAGMPNATFKKPIGEHVKNILRGRARWGCNHQLVGTWAKLPAGQMELTGAAAFPRAAPKRSRSGEPVRAPVAMAPLA